MKDSRIRYTVEHRVLPELFYNYMQDFTAKILHNDFIYDLFCRAYEINGKKCPYSPYDFIITKEVMDNRTVMALITLPQPEEETLCHCIYLIYDASYRKGFYYCVELGANDQLFLCAWTHEMVHHNFGTCPMDRQDQFHRCLQIWEVLDDRERVEGEGYGYENFRMYDPWLKDLP